MKWNIQITRKAEKQIKQLPEGIRKKLIALILDIELGGPVRGNWPNYGKLDDTRHHCHIRKGKPCFVAVWEVTDKKINLVEVKYVGTHEKAPY
jgi:mRNA-degrading endonuclease RelE of RelBE toxin-antitoxin system